MKSQGTLKNSKSGHLLQYGRSGVITAAGKFMLAAVILAATLVFALLPVSGVPGHSQGQKDNDSESKVQQGFAIAPVPLDLRGKNRALVGKGSYIVNAQSGCNDCHTTPSYAPG